ncbi:MAG: hypothetical protein D6820_00960 [Lentisphaerae bacterium]|nr:MAG: hypothetical protein D6820_00960 [Lentisphaerota bacterium]
MGNIDHFIQGQQERNIKLIQNSRYMRDCVESNVLPFRLDIASEEILSDRQQTILSALEKDAARIAIESLASLAKIGELDHLGGGLGIIPVLTQAVALSDYQKIEYTIENAHCSIGYYSVLAAFGFLDRETVIEKFRRSLDIPGHVSWVPGGTQLNGGRLGVMIPVVVGQALGKKATFGSGSWCICSCGDAGWISGQALNGWNAADLHKAPVTFVMDRNGIQLSGSNREIMDKDPRGIIASLGIEIIEVEHLLSPAAVYAALRQGYQLAQEGKPNLIYPVGSHMTIRELGEKFNIAGEVAEFAAANQVELDRKIWVPGSLMSYRDVIPMLECIFLVNELPGGKGHHDGSMKGRDAEEVLANPMLTLTEEEKQALAELSSQPARVVVTKARPAPGTPNLDIPEEAIASVELPGAGKAVSPRAGVQAAYEMVAKLHPDKMYVVSCDLDPSTKLDKAKKHLAADHKFELSIEEQAAGLLADGLAMSGQPQQLVVVSTFAAFWEGIAREALDLWRYQRNLNGVNEGLNVCIHMSHVGSNTGRDHFSGWSLDWVNVGLTYLPYLHRFYAPADARAAFLAVKDIAASYGAHIICVPRDNLPILTDENGKEIFNPTDAWEPLTQLRKKENAKIAVLGLGATGFLAAEVADELGNVDAYVVNGFPFNDGQLEALAEQYPGGLVTVEDGNIGNRTSGLRGFAAMVATNLGTRVPLAHIGIVDPRIAPADGFPELWEHFGITKANLITAIKSL